MQNVLSQRRKEETPRDLIILGMEGLAGSSGVNSSENHQAGNGICIDNGNLWCYNEIRLLDEGASHTTS